jgi:hypothetical protein
LRLSHTKLRQLALRISSISVTVITPGAGCSITSTPTVSTIGAVGCFTFRAAFFTGARLAVPLRSFARFCTFDAFLRFAMIDPRSGWYLPTH